MKMAYGEIVKDVKKCASPMTCRFMGKIRLCAVKRVHHIVFKPRTQSDCFWCCFA